ncbi:MAG: sodium-dependent transporter [Clostridia bacterium]|nr:sodium-dependent transporter [Clostridia bacterium]MCI1999405.1 sodium-dependent transporter [Clostridia bacterium]MCI2015093.1 sodium-dependent transporter [Clostridia bacterium]
MQEREKFGSRLGFILVSAGCAIGLGNVWKFPYMAGQYGGAAFILIYLVFLAILGIPVLVCEISVGRGSKRSIATAFQEIEPKGTKWHRFGWFGIIGNYLLMMFYTMVCGWMLYYAYLTLVGKFEGLGSDAVAGVFTSMLGSFPTMAFWMIVGVIISFGICSLGLNKGVEKVSKVMMLALIILMVVLAAHSLMLKNAEEGIQFYLIPNFGRMSENGVGTVVYGALSQAFFTLSIGMGSMEIFGSYMDRKHAITSEAINITLLDTFVAIMAGFIIIPACFSYNVEVGAGPSLLFITMPNIFNNMIGGRLWGTMFFVFMSFAALSTEIAVFENIISMGIDKWGLTRKKAVSINIVLVILLSLPAVMGFNILSVIQPLGKGTAIMDLEDFIVSNNILPLGSLVFVLYCASKNGWDWQGFLDEANSGIGRKFPSSNILRSYMTYVLPFIIIVVYLKGYYDMFKSKPAPVFIGWMIVALAFLYLIFFLIRGGKRKSNKNL